MGFLRDNGWNRYVFCLDIGTYLRCLPMSRVCTVCGHPDREAIEGALVAGETYRTIADRSGLSKTALIRHKAEHLPAAIAQATAAAAVVHGDTLLDQVRDLQRRALGILDKAEAANDLRTALLAIREARGNLELLAKLLGELQAEGTVNILISPQWLQARTTLLAALGPYPEARVAVAGELARLT
jgi:hypothetical protein